MGSVTSLMCNGTFFFFFSRISGCLLAAEPACCGLARLFERAVVLSSRLRASYSLCVRGIGITCSFRECFLNDDLVGLFAD